MELQWPPRMPALSDCLGMLTVSDLRSLIKRFWWLPVVGCALALGIGVGVTHWQPDRYLSRAQVRFIPPQVAERFVTPNLSMQIEQRVFALAQLLRSRITATRIVESFQLYPERRRFYTVADLLPTFQEHLQIQTVGNSNSDRGQVVPTVEITFSYSDAATAQKVVQRLVELIFEENRRYRSDQSIGTTEFLNEQAKAMESEIDEVEARLGELQHDTNNPNNPNQLGLSTQRLYAVDTRIRDLTDDLREREKERDRATQLIKATDQRAAAIDKEDPEASILRQGFNTATDRTRHRLFDVRAKVLAIRQRYLPSHPDREPAETELAQAQQEYDHASKTEVTQERNQRKAALMNDRAGYQAELRAAEVSIADLRRQEVELRAESQRVRNSMSIEPSTNTEQLALARQYSNLKEQYTILVKKQHDSQTASDMERRGQGETVEMIEPPSLASSPQYPNRPTRLGMFTSGGLALGLFLACLLYLQRLRICSHRALEAWSQLPVLSVFSGKQICGPAEPSGALVERWVQRSAITLLPLVLLLAGCSTFRQTPAALVQSGIALETKGNMAGALILYRKAIQLDARCLPAYKALALAAMREGQLSAAREAFIRASELSPDDSRLKAQLADISYRLYFSNPGRPAALLREVEIMTAELMERWPKLPDGYRIQSQILLERRQLDGATQLLEKALQHSPGEPALSSQLAAVYYQNGQPLVAETLLRSVIDSSPDFANAYDLLYLQAMQAGRRKLATDILDQKWKYFRSVETGLQVAAHAYALDQKDQAVAFLAALPTAAKKEPLSAAKIGDFWLNRADLTRARTAYESGQRAEPTLRSDYSGRLVELLLASGKPEEAQRLVEAEQSKTPHDLSLQAIHAALRLAATKPEQRREARAKLEQLSAQMPNSPFVRFHLGRAYLLEGNAPKATEHLERSVALDANYAPGWLALAEADLMTGETARGERNVNTILRRLPEHPIALQLSARASMIKQRPQEAEDLLSRAIRSQPENLAALYDLFQAQMSQQKWDAADQTITLLRKSSAAGEWKVDLAEAQLAGRRGQPDRCIEILARALQTQPHVLALRGAYAAVLLNSSRGPAALAQYDQLRKEQPDNFEFQLGWASSLAINNKPSEALTALEDLQRQRPSDTRVWTHFAVLAQQAGRTADALRAYRAAVARDESNPLILNNLAWLLLHSNQELPEALALAQRAQKLMPKSGDIDDTLALAYRKMGLHRDALATYQQMLTYLPIEERKRIQTLISETKQERPHEPRA